MAVRGVAILADGVQNSYQLTRLTDDSGLTELAARDLPLDALIDRIYLRLLTRRSKFLSVYQFPQLIRRITENGDQAIILAQTLYWFDNGRHGRPRAQTFKNGHYWFYKTHEEFGDEVGLTAARTKVCCPVWS